ncbi:hypothetical protein HELRODRAFT_160526 [Helobdella robusta]|uniref:PH domain-containing protein n=1 Tax=Helobdella robusta TaxID=6412 RepID=T1EQC9_HELRO|nr:hypothetical protein HELRODRAFT_160526 [Helobdella robusta]ESO06359.1 hypothetical protein HELRODRAFT_160526 [Helobdella robusta]
MLSRQPCEKILTNPKRRLLHEGPMLLMETSKTTDMYLFLFDDILLLTKVKKPPRKRSTNLENLNPYLSRNLQTEGLSFVVHRQPLALDRFTVHNVSTADAAANSLKHAFVIVQISRFQQILSLYTLQAYSEPAKMQWLHMLQSSQEKYRENLKKISQQNSQQNSQQKQAATSPLSSSSSSNINSANNINNLMDSNGNSNITFVFYHKDLDSPVSNAHAVKDNFHLTPNFKNFDDTHNHNGNNLFCNNNYLLKRCSSPGDVALFAVPRKNEDTSLVKSSQNCKQENKNGSTPTHQILEEEENKLHHQQPNEQQQVLQEQQKQQQHQPENNSNVELTVTTVEDDGSNTYDLYFNFISQRQHILQQTAQHQQSVCNKIQINNPNSFLSLPNSNKNVRDEEGDETDEDKHSGTYDDANNNSFNQCNLLKSNIANSCMTNLRFSNPNTPNFKNYQGPFNISQQRTTAFHKYLPASNMSNSNNITNCNIINNSSINNRLKSNSLRSKTRPTSLYSKRRTQLKAIREKSLSIDLPNPPATFSVLSSHPNKSNKSSFDDDHCKASISNVPKITSRDDNTHNLHIQTDDEVDDLGKNLNNRYLQKTGQKLSSHANPKKLQREDNYDAPNKTTCNYMVNNLAASNNQQYKNNFNNNNNINTPNQLINNITYINNNTQKCNDDSGNFKNISMKN